MSKRIALGVASALLGISGVAGASVAMTSSADVDSEDSSASFSFSSDSSPDLSAATGLLDNAPGVADVLAQAEGAQAMAENLVDTVAGQLPVSDLTDMLDMVPGVCGSLPVSLPMPANTMGTALSFFGTIQGMIGQQLAMVAGLAPSTPTVLSAPDVLNKVNGEVACAAEGGALPVDVPVELDACDVNAGAVNALPAPAHGVVAGALHDVNAATGSGIGMEGNHIGVQCSSAGLPIPAATPSATVPSQSVAPQTIVPAAPIPAVNLPEVDLETPVGTVSTPSVDVTSGVIPAITVGPISTPAISLPALPLGSIVGGVSGSAEASDGGFLGNLLG